MRVARSCPAVAALIGAVVGLGVACGRGGGAAASAADVTRGRALFQGTCATCHGSDAAGMPRLGRGLHGNAFVRARTDRELVDFLRQGRRATHPENLTRVDMPPKGGNPALTEEDLALIVVYLRSLGS